MILRKVVAKLSSDMEFYLSNNKFSKKKQNVIQCTRISRINLQISNQYYITHLIALFNESYINSAKHEF